MRPSLQPGAASRPVAVYRSRPSPASHCPRPNQHNKPGGHECVVTHQPQPRPVAERHLQALLNLLQRLLPPPALQGLRAGRRDVQGSNSTHVPACRYAVPSRARRARTGRLVEHWWQRRRRMEWCGPAVRQWTWGHGPRSCRDGLPKQGVSAGCTRGALEGAGPCPCCTVAAEGLHTTRGEVRPGCHNSRCQLSG